MDPVREAVVLTAKTARTMTAATGRTRRQLRRR